MQNTIASPDKRHWQPKAAPQDLTEESEHSALPLQRSAEQSNGQPSSSQQELLGKGQLPLLSWQSSDSDTIPAVQGGQLDILDEAQAASSIPGWLSQAEKDANLAASGFDMQKSDSPRILVTVAHSLPGAPQIKHPKVRLVSISRPWKSFAICFQSSRA